MPLFLPALRAVGRSCLLRQNYIKPFIRHGHYCPIQCLSSIAGVDSFSSRNVIHRPRKSFNSYEKLQRRWFLGCGDGEEGSALSKMYEEKLFTSDFNAIWIGWKMANPILRLRCNDVIGYSPEQLFDVVAAVDLYEDFLPWCQRSEIVRRHPDGSFDAELEIGFKFLVESYISHVVLDKPKFIKTTASESNLFEHLINIWEFRLGPSPETCNLYFLVDFKFRSPLYRQVASMFFREVVTPSLIDAICYMVQGQSWSKGF